VYIFALSRVVYVPTGLIIKGFAYCGPNDKMWTRAEQTITFSGDVLVRPDEMEEKHERHKKDN